MRGSKKILRAYLLLFGVCAHFQTAAQDMTAWGTLPLQFFESRGVPADAVGISLAVFKSGELRGPPTWIEHRARQPMNPASTIKLVTTRAAWSILGLDYRSRTRVWTTGRVRAGVLKGPIYIQGGGDPKLVVEDIEQIVDQLRAKGIRVIEGDFVLDGSRFAEAPGDPNAFDGRGYKPYNVEPHAAMFNFKSVRVGLRPDRGRVAVETMPNLHGLRINTSIRLVQGGCGANTLEWIQRANLIDVSGRMGRNCPWQENYISVYSHLQYAQRLFAASWKNAGGVFRGKAREGKTPGNAELLVDWISPRPLIDVLADINKLSNNPMARTVFLNLSAETGGPGSRDDAEKRVRAWLAERGLSFSELVMDNGSGLSRNERISPRSLTELLVDAMLAPQAMEWIGTLPAAGVEGTIRRRLKDGSVAGRAWIKTGSLEGVRAYSGYILSQSGHWVAFSAIINHPRAVEAAPSLDSLVKWIVETL